MHIPDGFLDSRVWLPLDAAALPAIAWCARRSKAAVEETRVPLLGVMGAFLFAAQMINFPVTAGASAHLVGSALLAILFGPCTAALVMGAILLIQAVLFQDGGIAAWGANFFNMGIIGCFAGYLPYAIARRAAPKLRLAAVFAGAWLALMAGAAAVAAELSFSRNVAPPAALFGSLLAAHAVAGIAEGVLTVIALRALERLAPGAVRAAGPA